MMSQIPIGASLGTHHISIESHSCKGGYTSQNCTHFITKLALDRAERHLAWCRFSGIFDISEGYPKDAVALRNRRLEVRALPGAFT